jgi:GTP-binding protein HflX
VLVHLRLAGRSPNDQDDVDELKLLAEAAGAVVCASVSGSRQAPVAATFLGSGKVEEIRRVIERDQANLVVVNHELSPAQERNLEKAIQCRVLDRTGLILDIFAQRARSHEGKLQVELAQLEHLSTRLVRGWTHLERQKGGIGLRGPGETQLEVDRRLIRARIKRLHERLRQVSVQRRGRRKSREKVPIPTVSMVGYTNAGKSTLFNCLTGAEVFAADQLFATLDPTMRRVRLPGHDRLNGKARPGATAVILTDTVGFIRHLPHNLVEAFKSTLEEVAAADLLIHVTDGANAQRIEHIEQVSKVLAEIGADQIPQLLVFNKIDVTGQAPAIERDAAGAIRKIWVSAKTGAGLDFLVQAISEHFHRFRQLQRLLIPTEAGRLRALIYDRLDVIGETALDHGGWTIDVMLDRAQLGWLMERDEFRSEYLSAHANDTVLAPTGSYP